MAKDRTNSVTPCTKCGETDGDGDGGGRAKKQYARRINDLLPKKVS